jgi:L-ascorbate metabolism protein UlaG (beta-lactamase superfamily)
MGRIIWAGHATVRIELDGVTLLTDPLLRRAAGPLARRGEVPAGIADDLDAVLISHLHHDHLDLASLRRIDPAVPVVAPAGSAPILRRAGGRRVIELVPGGSVAFGDVVVRATAALHAGGRPPARGRGVPALGYLVEGSRRVYFAGDTDIFPGMADLAPGLDVALLPVWGWGPTIGAGHLDPAGAARALRLLAPRIAVPIHWGTLYPRWIPAGRRGFLDWPGERFAQAAAVEAPDVRVTVLAPGEAIAIPERPTA